MKLTLDDLVPAEAEFSLSKYPEKTFVLKNFSLRVQAWMHKKFGEEKIKEIFETQNLDGISEIAFFLLKPNDSIKSIEEFQEAIVNQKDRLALMRSLLQTIGVSQPILEKLSQEYDAGNAPSLSLPTGAPSTTK